MFHLRNKRKISYIILLTIIALSIFSLTNKTIGINGLSIDPYSYLVASSITKLKISMMNFIIGNDKIRSIKRKPSKEFVLIKKLEWQNSIYKKKLDGVSKLFPMKLDYRFAFYKFIGSQIIARDINYNGKFWINLGTNNHVVSGTPIITNNLELIGKVKNSYPSKSSVWSILTKGNVIDAVDSRTNGWGIYRGTGKPYAVYTYFSDKPLSVGDVLKTGGLDGKYPKNIIIGIITKIIDEDSLKTVAEVKPATEANRSLYVIAVVKNDDMEDSRNIHFRNNS